jgi:hypothetical protein
MEIDARPRRLSRNDGCIIQIMVAYGAPLLLGVYRQPPDFAL